MWLLRSPAMIDDRSVRNLACAQIASRGRPGFRDRHPRFSVMRPERNEIERTRSLNARSNRVGDGRVIGIGPRQPIGLERKDAQAPVRIIPRPKCTGRGELRRLVRQRVEIGAFLHNRHIWRERRQRLNLFVEAGSAVPGDDAHACRRA
jgi:hypothetical protein